MSPTTPAGASTRSSVSPGRRSCVQLSHKNWLNPGGMSPRRRVWPCADEWHPAFRHAPAAGPGVCSCSATSARPVAACAAIAGRFVPVGPVREPQRTDGRCPAPTAPKRRADAGGTPFTRCRVVRGGEVMRCARRRCRPRGAADGLAPPAPAAPDTRRAGPRRRAVPARG